MAMNYEFERLIAEARRTGKDEALRVLEAQREIFNSLREAGIVEELPLETRPLQGQPESSPKLPDLRQETYDLLGTLREPSPQEREALRKKGFIFLRVRAKSLGKVCVEEEGYFGYVDPSESLRSYAPPQDFEVAVNPRKLRIPQSNNSSQIRQLGMIEKYSKEEVEPKVPNAKAIMLPVTGYAQLDIDFQKQNDEKLFKDFWVRALDTTVDSYVAVVGRNDPAYPLYVDDWLADDDLDVVWAVPAVVFPRK